MLVLSDHGMATLSASRLITLADYCDTTLFTLSDRLPVVAIWPNDGSAAGIERVFGLLQGKHPRMRVYKKQDLPVRYHYSNHKRIAPIIAVPDIGWVIQVRQFRSVKYICCITVFLRVVHVTGSLPTHPEVTRRHSAPRCSARTAMTLATTR